MRTFPPLVLLAAALGLGGCLNYPRLKPANPGQLLADRPLAARVAQGGVSVVVQPDQWNGDPVGLPEMLTPLLVTIENGSQRSLRIRFQEFALVGRSGFRYAAIPPLQTDPERRSDARTPDGTPVQAVWRMGPGLSFTPRFGYSGGFYVAPGWSSYYPGYGVWGGPFSWNPWYYGNAYGFWREPLPTRDMLERAMPEGVLQSEGRVSGFLYFPSVRREDGVTFELDLVDAKSGESLGKAALPFSIEP